MTTHVLSFFQTTIGKKVAMAVSGIIGFGFVLGHMIGNFLIHFGPDTFNAYAAAIHANLALLWGTRLVLLVAVGVHVLSAASLVATNAAARPRSYAERKDLATNYAALTMKYGGFLLLAFIIFHLAHLTYGKTELMGYVFDPANAYNNVVLGFQHPVVAVTYIVAMAILGMHLYHGLWSMFQTLGINHPRYNEWRNAFAATFTVVIVVGFISVPVSVLTGTLEPTDDSLVLERVEIIEEVVVPAGH